MNKYCKVVNKIDILIDKTMKQINDNNTTDMFKAVANVALLSRYEALQEVRRIVIDELQEESK